MLGLMGCTLRSEAHCIQIEELLTYLLTARAQPGWDHIYHVLRRMLLSDSPDGPGPHIKLPAE